MADDSNYSKRELDHYFNDMKERLKKQDEMLSKQDEMLSKIFEQTSKTNGRVSSLEFWRNAIGWGFGVIMTITLFTLNYIK